MTCFTSAIISDNSHLGIFRRVPVNVSLRTPRSNESFNWPPEMEIPSPSVRDTVLHVCKQDSIIDGKIITPDGCFTFDLYKYDFQWELVLTFNTIITLEKSTYYTHIHFNIINVHCIKNDILYCIKAYNIIPLDSFYMLIKVIVFIEGWIDKFFSWHKCFDDSPPLH